MGIPEIVALVQLGILVIPLITQIVQQVEAMVQQAQATGAAPSTSTDKLNSALAFFNQLWPTLSQSGTGKKITAALSPTQITQGVTDLINGAVAMANALGVFKKSTPAASSPAASTS